jgi:MerR family regulatory protein
MLKPRPHPVRSARIWLTVIAVTERDRKLLTTAQVAKHLGISTRTLVRYAEKGYVRPEMTLPSGHRRWVLEDVRRQILESGQPGDDQT